MGYRGKGIVLAFGLAVASTGCGTTRMTDTQRAASEMMLVSNAIDEAVMRLDFTALEGKPVFLDTQYLDGAVDKGYLISSLRQHLLAQGALLQEDRLKSIYVVEPRTGAVGTDRHSLLVGTPAVTLPSITAIPVTNIPEIALIKKTDQKGVAKLAVFAYNRVNGRAVWQSGLVQANSNLKDTWIFGAGPFSRGSIKPQTELAGEPLPNISVPLVGSKDDHTPALNSHQTATATKPFLFTNSNQPPPLQPVPFALLGVTGPAGVIDHPLILTNPQEATGPATIVPASGTNR